MKRPRPRLVRAVRVRAKLLLRKFDRETPEWMRWLTPWATSLILHIAAVTALGLLVYASVDHSKNPDALESSLFASQLKDDLTSLKPADQAGDPFTTLKTDEAPSFSIDSKGATDSATPDTLLPIGAGDGRMNQPNASELSAAQDLTAIGMTKFEPSAPFAGRSLKERARIVRREGGTVESEQAVEMGLDWLSRHQKKDGSWSLDHHPQCKGKGCPHDGHMTSDVAATGLALLPMLGAGQTHKLGRYQPHVQKGLDWLISVQKSDGEIYTGGDGNALMYSHAIATMALCEALGLTQDEALCPAATKAVQFLIKSQNLNDGGWRYNPNDAGDTSVFGWVMMALRSAQLAHIKVPGEVFKAATNYLDRAQTNKGGTQYGYVPGQGSSVVMSAEALLIRQYLGWPREKPELSSGVKHVSSNILEDKQRNIYYWYYATQLLHNMQNAAWKEWNPRVRNGLVAMQVRGNGCDHGSWDPHKPSSDYWGSCAGRHFTTAMSLLTLEVYYRYLPLYKARGNSISE